MAVCPPREQLERLLAEALGDGERALLEAHVEACSSCEEQLAQLAAAQSPPLATASSVSGVAQEGESQLAGHEEAFLEQMKKTPPRAARPRRADYSPDEPRPPEVPGYEILEVLGYGATGVVYKARQRALNRLVALKMIRGAEYSRPEDRLRFQIEGEVVARLRHPNIVQIYEVGSHAGQPFFAFEFVDGGCLADRLGGAQPPRQAAELVEALARAAHAAHLQGIVHRDLKPSNVLLARSNRSEESSMPGRAVTAYGVPMIADFGLAKQLGSDVRLTQTGTALGTPRYMAPEQCRGPSRDIGPAADLYALGTILYELLTGRVPFPSADFRTLLNQVVEQEPPPPSQVVPGLPRDLECICLKCLQKEPAQRYASAVALAEDLRCYLDHRPITARPVGRGERLWRWCRRNPAAAGLAAAVAALLVVTTAATSLVALGLRRERDAILAGQQHLHEAERHRQEELARLLLTATPASVPYFLAELRAVPDLALPLWRRAFADEASDPGRRLRAAVALTLLGEAQVNLLLESIATAPATECHNLLSALTVVKTAVLEPLRERARSERNLTTRARLAATLLHLGDAAAARAVLAAAADPAPRAAFIHEFPAWHGDLMSLAALLRGDADAAFRSGLLAALGRLEPRVLAAEEQRALEQVFRELYTAAPDGGTHSAAGWALRRWQVPVPALPVSSAPRPGCQWFVSASGLTLVEIPAGVFTMGDPIMGRTNPAHPVVLTRSFFLSDREVPVRLFHQFCADRDYPTEEKPANWSGPLRRVSPTDDCPVQAVSWRDAVLFCNWLSRHEGRRPCYVRTGTTPERWGCQFDADGYRLPTEAEWEYANRAGSTTLFPIGNEPDLLTSYANMELLRALPSGSRLPNRWGLFDMMGNVWEFCWDD
ncbi:MAG: bifunctional serine/threonine-protein kinase/formylglycine-generating enzyme family protein, partial [Gemmataceae bacterium]|nr:bifunctional serine/threonine-protein kinase/formylglycine-generating enzyme family protein [Gemmataceae bacterium]